MGRKKTSGIDSLAIKNHIIDTAEDLFRDIGYVKTTVSDIARHLGMSQSNIYRYFPTKASINETICDRLVHSIEDQCWESLVKDGTSIERLKRFISKYHKVIRVNIIKEQKLYDMISIAMNEHWDVIQKHSQRIRDLLKIIIDQGIASGEFRSIDSAKMALAIHESLAVFIYPSLIEHWVADAQHDNKPDSLEEELENLLDLILHGLVSHG